VVLGKAGRNFAAGMSGGIAYVYDSDRGFRHKCNMEMITLEKLTEEDELTVHDLLLNHHRYTDSPIAKKILDDFKNNIKRFIKVMPLEYKRILDNKKAEAKMDLVEVSDG